MSQDRSEELPCLALLSIKLQHRKRAESHRTAAPSVSSPTSAPYSRITEQSILPARPPTRLPGQPRQSIDILFQVLGLLRSTEVEKSSLSYSLSSLDPGLAVAPGSVRFNGYHLPSS